jgi:hypothetical protein
VSNESLLISAAVFMCALGVLVGVLERTRPPPATPGITFTGIAGVFLGLSATVEHIRWLYLPRVILLLGCAAISASCFPAIRPRAPRRLYRRQSAQRTTPAELRLGR